MANLSETSTYDAGVYQLETTDPVVGGPSGVSNAPLKNLANRTKYLKDHVDALEASRAPLASPEFTGTPTAPTPASSSNNTQIATTAFVQTALTGISGGGIVTSVAGKTGAVTLVVGDVSGAAPTASPAFSGTPTAPTATAGTNTTQLATTAFVQSALSGFSSGVTSVAGKTGVVTLTVSDVSGAAPLASPTFTGTPAAPTAATGTNTTQLATTAFVIANSVRTNGTNASGTWGISITGNAATATSATSATVATSATSATTATNQSGGTVNATTGSFTGDVTVSGGITLSTGGDLLVTGSTDNTFGIFKSGFSFISCDGSNTVRLTSGQELRLQGNNATSPIQFFDGGGNNLSHIGNNGSYYAGSDAILKENVRPLQYGLSDVLKLEPKVYNLISETAIREESNLAPVDRFGLIAQDVDPILPELVSETEILALDYVGLIPVLINAIKEQNAAIEKLKADVLALS